MCGLKEPSVKGLLDLGNLGTGKACLEEANLHKDMHVEGWVVPPPVLDKRSQYFEVDC